MKSTIYGSGLNSVITLYRIHQGEGYFRKDTSTSHSQVRLLQTKLNEMGYACGDADGKYGDKTVAAVKAFQKANKLSADGLFGKASLQALESKMNGTHLDTQCQNSSDTGAYGCYDKTSDALAESKYKVSSAMRIKTYADAAERIYAYAGAGTPLTVEQLMQNLDSKAANTELLYGDLDCAGYIYEGRNKQGAKGASSELGYYLEFFGSIRDLGGYEKLIPGMELFQGFRRSATSNRFYASHIGVYAGKKTLQGSTVHAVYQSSQQYPSLKKKYDKTEGPNLTGMSDDWNYWGWSKFVKLR